MNERRIDGAVAAILNLHELVINRGSKAGVAKGQKYAVLNKNAVAIKDPETGESLGTVDVAKVLVEVIRVKTNLAVCRTYIEKQSKGILSAADLFAPSRRIRETLRAADKPTVAELAESASYVSVGDPIVQVLNDDEYSTEF